MTAEQAAEPTAEPAGAPAVVPERTPVRRRALRIYDRAAAVRAGESHDPTVVLGTVRPPNGADETRVMSTAETEAVRRGAEASALFSGSAEAEARSRHFHGPGKDVMEEREQTAERQRVATGEIRVATAPENRKGVVPGSGEGGPTDGAGDGES
jgi:hypothetical protein